MIKVIFSCGGCDAEAQGTSHIRRQFYGFNGKSYGFGTYKVDSIESVCPDGWMAFDPWTQCTYCPDCWESINEQDDSIATQQEVNR